jgi:lipopolysaccharide export system permease protein
MKLLRRPLISKIDRYIMRKFLSTFFLSISLIIIIVIIFDISENIDDFIDKQAPVSEIIFVYYLNFIPYFVNLFSALFTFIAVIFFTAKMAAQSEIIAILGSGISFRRLLVPYLISSLLIAIMSLYLANFLIPITNKNRLNFVNTYIKNKYHNTNRNIHMQIAHGTFVYVESYNVDLDVGYNFTMEKYSDEILYYKMTANTMQWDSLTMRWRLNNYTIHLISGMNEKLFSGAKKDTAIALKPSDFNKKTDDIELMSYSQLRDFIDQERLKGSDNVKYYEVEKHKRIAFPFASLVLTLIAVSVSSRKVRGGIGLHIAFGLSVTFIFILFQKVTETFAIYSDWPPGLAVWLPNIVFGILAIYLIYKAPK